MSDYTDLKKRLEFTAGPWSDYSLTTDVLTCIQELEAQLEFTRRQQLQDVCELEDAEDKLEQQLGLYHELLYQVEIKIPNESRHETALRQMKAANAPQNNPPQAARENNHAPND